MKNRPFIVVLIISACMVTFATSVICVGAFFLNYDSKTQAPVTTKVTYDSMTPSPSTVTRLPLPPTLSPVSTKPSETSPFNESTVEIAPWYYNSVLGDNGYINYALCLSLRNKTSKPILIKGENAYKRDALANAQSVSIQPYAVALQTFWEGKVMTDQGKEYDATWQTPQGETLWWDKGYYVLMPNVPVTGWQYGGFGSGFFCLRFSVPEKLKPTKIVIGRWGATSHEIAFNLAPGIDKLGKLAIDSSGAKPMPSVFTLGKKLEIETSKLSSAKSTNARDSGQRLITLKLHNPNITDSIQADPFVALVDADGVLVSDFNGNRRNCLDKNGKSVSGELGPDQTWICTYEFYFANYLFQTEGDPFWLRLTQGILKNTQNPLYVVISDYNDAVMLK